MPWESVTIVETVSGLALRRGHAVCSWSGRNPLSLDMNQSSSLATATAADQAEFLADVLGGMNRSQRSLPCKYFYDEAGSRLFDEICELDEYYLTRTELGIMECHVDEMADQIGEGVMLVEYGSGSSIKTRLLLDALTAPAAYVPIDVSANHLHATAEELAERYPEIEILPLVADFTSDYQLPKIDGRALSRGDLFPRFDDWQPRRVASPAAVGPDFQADRTARRFADRNRFAKRSRRDRGGLQRFPWRHRPIQSQPAQTYQSRTRGNL